MFGVNKSSFKDRFKNLGPTIDPCGFSHAMPSNYQLHCLCGDGLFFSEI